ncbi:RelA/SpoT family protein [Halosquirtibacter xylanolyticus]|uniref:RelA/SpoT family protein n=1 Tax=Halosquirtibacter xylanolyticus TaxID=3374599 RepID=UPI00374A8E72|nr:RelA/SpoT family protein [Prolixibacteraceae bacterium]
MTNKDELYILELEDQLKSYCVSKLKEEEIDKVDNARRLASSILSNRKLPDGEPYYAHSLGVALIAGEEMGLASDSIIASLLHNTTALQTDIEEYLNQINESYGETVVVILRGLTKINSLDKDNIAIQSDNFRRLMMTLSGDIRVILVKIADQLRDMRNLHYFPEEKKMSFAHETNYLYAPFAHRLGLYKINSELQDLWLKTIHSEDYYFIDKNLEKTGSFRENFVSEFVKPIEDKLKRKGFQFEMKARTKSIYSIWNKMQKKKVDFEDVHDVFAIRVILDSEQHEEKSNCWQVFSIVTEHYQTNPNRLRDWISIPKSNGYESLHTTVLGPGSRWVEVQIRTTRMNDTAENGLAAHWRYKGGKESGSFDDWLKSVREILENPDLNPFDFIDEFKTNVYEDELFVFTPKGDLKKLRADATLLDFAYDIHSQVGDQCVGGLVNGKKVSIKHKLQNGDHISIETSKSQKPKMDWLEFVVTTKAKSRIKVSLNEEQRKLAEQGKEIVKRKFKNWKIDYNDRIIQEVLDYCKIKLSKDLYAKIAEDKIDILDIKNFITQKEEKANNNDTTQTNLEALLGEDLVDDLNIDGSDDFLVIDNNITNVVYKLSKCCNPILGDDIFGFVTIKEGIKIHRRTCPNAPQMLERYPYRMLKAKWKGENNTKKSFQATLHITGLDQTNIVGDISQLVSKEAGIQMRSISFDSGNGQIEGIIKVYVYDLGHLEFLMQKLKNARGINTVSRSDG